MSSIRIQIVRKALVALASLAITSAVFAQGIPDDRNINIIGINPPTAVNGVPDPGLKQQNEPACAMKPINPLQIICAFNDYRGVDNPAFGDAWEGYAWSINGGQTWFSDLLPGSPGDALNSVGLDFAADAQVVAAPGIALISYIAADRGENADGGLFLQRMLEVNREAGAPWVPAAAPIEVDSGNADKFIDKPFMLLHPAPAGSGTVMVDSMLEDGTPISQQVPAASIFLAYTTFSGSADDGDLVSKILLATSEDYGGTWTSQELANSSCEMPGQGHCKDKGQGHDKGKGRGHSKRKDVIQSAAIAAEGDKVCAVWRRFEDDDDPDAIMASCSADRGETFAPPMVVSTAPDFIPFDQGTTENSFRTNSYPVIVHDGDLFYAFWGSRIATSSPFYARIVYSTSTDGSVWTPPVMLDNPTDGHQFMPSVAAARGTIQLAWYDTRNNLFFADFIQDVRGIGGVPDTDANKIIRNKGDIRTAQIIGGVATPSVQVSRYVEGALEIEGTVLPVQQLEFNFMNDRMFAQGTVPFDGDYPNVAAPTFRLENDQWVSNITPSDTIKPVDFLVTWSDNRDVRGNVWNDLVIPTVYTPAEMTSAMTATDGDKENTPQGVENQQPETLLAGHDADGKISAKLESVRAVSVADTGSKTVRADAEPDPAGTYPGCDATTYPNADRSRNQNVYSSIVRPGVSFDSPSSSKPTGSIQRAHVVWVSNNSDALATYTLRIDNQPPDAPMNGRASFLQVPVAPFTNTDGFLDNIAVAIDANSTVARTVYVTSLTEEPEIGISVTDGGTVVFGTITLNADVLTPDVQNPDVQNPDVQNPDIQNAEVHNPDVQNVVITTVQNPDVQNPDVQNPDVQNPDVQNADYQNPDVQNPDIQNPDIQNGSLDGSSTENPDTEYDGMLTGTDREGYTDMSYEVTNDGNTTTSFNLDAFINGVTDGLKTQLIATRTHATETSFECEPRKLVQNQVIFNKTDPDLSLILGDSDDGVFGDGSAYIAPGETILVTLRVWGDPALFNPELAGIRVIAQSCNSVNKVIGSGTVDCDPPQDQANPTAATVTFDFVPPLPDQSTVGPLNAELERFGVEWSEQGGILRLLTTLDGAGPFAGIDPPSLAFNSSGSPDGVHTLRFVCPDGSGRRATVTSASINVTDTEAVPSPRVSATSFDINGVSLEGSNLTVLSDTLEFAENPIATIRFTDNGGDGHILDNLVYEGLECVDFVTTFTENVITGDLSILNGGSFIVANTMNLLSPVPITSPVTVNGVTFGLDQGGFAPQTGTGGWLTSSSDFSIDPIATGWSADLDRVLSGNQFVPFGTTHGELTIPGLTTGTRYRLQLLFSNDLNTTANNIEVTVQGETYILDDWQQPPPPPGNKEAVNLIVEFTALSPSVVVEFDAGVGATSESGRAHVNGYAVHDLTFIIL